MDRYELFNSINEFMFAPDADERKRMFRDNPVLLTADAEAMLEEMVGEANARGDAKEVSCCEEHLALLRDCRRQMLNPLEDFYSTRQLETTFAEFAHGFPSLGQRRDYLTAHPELLGDRLDSVANAMVREWVARGHNDIAATLRLYRNLLIRCRSTPIDEAFAEFEIPPEEVASALAALFRANSPQEVLNCSIAHGRALSSPKVKNALNFYRAKFEDDAAMMERIEALLEGNPHWR